MKSCDNCYWKTENKRFCSWHEDRPSDNICDRHNFNCLGCRGYIATHKFRENIICINCLLDAIGVKKVEVSKEQYYYDGDYLGDSDEHSIDEIIDKMDAYNLGYEELPED